MPQILHPQQQDDLCAQTYPQKMGIDNSHASVSDQRGVSATFFVESVVEVTAEDTRQRDKKRVGGGRTYRE
jgi:hypothetical protein